MLDPRSFSISLARSRDISSDAMLAKVHKANPTAYMLEWFMSLVRDVFLILGSGSGYARVTHFFNELVTRVRTS